MSFKTNCFLLLCVTVLSCTSNSHDRYWYRYGWYEFYKGFGESEVYSHRMTRIDSIVITKTPIGADGTIIKDSATVSTWKPTRYIHKYDTDEPLLSQKYHEARIHRYEDDDFVYHDILFIWHPKADEKINELECRLVDDFLEEATFHLYNGRNILISENTHEYLDIPVDTANIFSIYEEAYKLKPDDFDWKTVYKYRKGDIYQAKDVDNNGKPNYVVTFHYDDKETIITKKQLWDKNTTSITTVKYRGDLYYPSFEQTIWYTKKGLKKTVQDGGYIECSYLSFDSSNNWTSRIITEEKNGVRKAELTTRKIYYWTLDE